MDTCEMIKSIISDEIVKKGLKQTYVAQKAGMRPASFGSFLKGNRGLKADELISISLLLGIPLSRYQEALEIIGKNA